MSWPCAARPGAQPCRCGPSMCKRTFHVPPASGTKAPFVGLTARPPPPAPRLVAAPGLCAPSWGLCCPPTPRHRRGGRREGSSWDLALQEPGARSPAERTGGAHGAAAGGPGGAPVGAPAGAVLGGGGGRAPHRLLEQLQPQVPLERLHGGGAPQRLPGHHLPALRGGQRGPARHGALHPLPGGPRGVPGLQGPLQGADPLGVRQAQRLARPREVLGEVPALHALHAGQGVQGGAQLLLHLQADSPPRGDVPEAEGDGGWQRHSGAACPRLDAEGEDPGRRRSRACPEERGAELSDAGQQPLHLHQPPAAPPGAAGAVSGVAGTDRTAPCHRGWSPVGWPLPARGPRGPARTPVVGFPADIWAKQRICQYYRASGPELEQPKPLGCHLALAGRALSAAGG